MGFLVLLTVSAVQNFELVWMGILCKIINSTFVVARVLWSRPWSVADRPHGGRGPSGPLARTVRPPSADRPDPGRAMQFYSFYCGVWYQLFIYGCLSHYCSGLGGLRKKLVGRFKSKHPRGDDADYTPTTDSEAQSSAGGTESMDTEDFPHIHHDYAIDTTGWTFPKRRFSMAEYCSRRTVNQYTLPSDTNVQFFHTQLQFDVFWGTLVDTNLHKHQVIDWSFMLGQSVMKDLIPKFETCGLYQFMGQRTDFSEMAVKQFLATSEIDIEEESITWITGFKRYSASFADFATANSLDYGIISAGLDLYTEDNFEDFVQFYEPARLEYPGGLERQQDSGIILL